MFSFFRRKKKDDGYAQLHRLCVISPRNKRCDGCELEINSCFKLMFANQTICVAPREMVNLKSSTKKRKAKK